MAVLSKSKILVYLLCLKRLWLEAYQPGDCDFASLAIGCRGARSHSSAGTVLSLQDDTAGGQGTQLMNRVINAIINRANLLN
jgi:hypothetical protein